MLIYLFAFKKMYPYQGDLNRGVDLRALPYSNTVEADIPRLFKNSSWFVNGNSKQQKNEKKSKRDKSTDNGLFGRSHGSRAPAVRVVVVTGRS